LTVSPRGDRKNCHVEQVCTMHNLQWAMTGSSGGAHCPLPIELVIAHCQLAIAAAQSAQWTIFNGQ
jgi:hypothetical protein